MAIVVCSSKDVFLISGLMAYRLMNCKWWRKNRQFILRSTVLLLSTVRIGETFG